MVDSGGQIIGENKAKILAMPSAATIRLQIEAALAHKVPSALTPAPRVIRPVTPTGVSEIDALLDGGLPVGAITEIVGPEVKRADCGRSFLPATPHTCRESLRVGGRFRLALS